jgi:hypothetical protein
MRLLGLLCTVLGILACDASSGVAQTVPDSLRDRRVRVYLARQESSIEGAVPRQIFRGTLVSVGSDSVVVRIHPAASPISISSRGIYQVDLSRGVSWSRTALTHGIKGAIVWAGIGAAGEEEFGGGPVENLLIWAGGGLVVGAVFGALCPEERWKRVLRR